MLFAHNEGIGDNKFGIIIVKSVLYITNNIIKIWIVKPSCQNILNKQVCYNKTSNCQDKNTTYCMLCCFVVYILYNYRQSIVIILSMVLAVKYDFEMMGHIAKGNLNIRIHRDITGEKWFGVSN